MNKKSIIVSVILFIFLGGCSEKFDIPLEIKKAQAMLEREEAGFSFKTIAYHNGKKGKKRKEWTVKKLGDFNVLLAVENVVIRKIEIIKLGNGGRQSPAGFSVNGGRRNGVNTPFNVCYPKGYIVLALKRVIKIDGVYKEVIYTPYTSEINTEDMQKKGMAYLLENLEAAETDLRDKRVSSQAFNGLAVNAVPKKVALALSLIEHIDPGRFQCDKSKETSFTSFLVNRFKWLTFEKKERMQELMDEVLVTVAANEGHAYAYSISSAGARGLFQFIPKTYRSIVRQYKDAELIPDFAAGMNNHHNAAKASLLLFDADLGYLPMKHRQALRDNPKAMGKYLAASYNGGPKRAERAILNHKWRWEKHVLPETQDYLKKFNAVWGLLD